MGLLFEDLEGSKCQEDVIASIGESAHPIRSVSLRLAASLQRYVRVYVNAVSAFDSRVKIRTGPSAGSWRCYGDQTLCDSATHKQPILLGIDEFSISLKRLRDRDAGAQQVDSFSSWLRGGIQRSTGASLVLTVSGSIGFESLGQPEVALWDCDDLDRRLSATSDNESGENALWRRWSSLLRTHALIAGKRHPTGIEMFQSACAVFRRRKRNDLERGGKDRVCFDRVWCSGA